MYARRTSPIRRRPQARRLRAEAVAASARVELSDNETLIAHLDLRIEMLKRELYGQRFERTARLLEQLEWSSKNSPPRRARMSLPRWPQRRRRRTFALHAQAAGAQTGLAQPFDPLATVQDRAAARD